MGDGERTRPRVSGECALAFANFCLSNQETKNPGKESQEISALQPFVSERLPHRQDACATAIPGLRFAGERARTGTAPAPCRATIRWSSSCRVRSNRSDPKNPPHSPSRCRPRRPSDRRSSPVPKSFVRFAHRPKARKQAFRRQSVGRSMEPRGTRPHVEVVKGPEGGGDT